MSRSTRVLSPRNVELPKHVIRAKTRPERRRRCLCLAAILMVLLALLSAGVVTIANFLVFSDDEGLSADKAFSQLRHPNRSRCAERVGIAEKIRSSDLVVIGREEENGRIQIVRTLLSPELRSPELSDNELKVSEWPPECVTRASKVRQVFFLGLNDRGDLFHRFRAENAQPKLTQVIKKIVDHAEMAANSSEGEPCPSAPCTFGSVCIKGIDGFAHCSCDSVCSEADRLETTPSCGSDHVTYRNKCELREAACEKQEDIFEIAEGHCDEAELCGECPYYGACVKSEATGRYQCTCQKCFGEGTTVCGSDGSEYPSVCELELRACEEQKNVSTVHAGSCGDPCSTGNPCSTFHVCSSDPDGLPRCSCPTCTDDDQDEVCGTDHITYPSMCHLKRAACETQKAIEPKYGGKCDVCTDVHCKHGSHCRNGKCVCPTKCPDDYEPVCGSDGKTYFNDCHLSASECSLGDRIDPTRRGRCPDSPGCPSPPCVCPKGVGGTECDQCLQSYWGYASDGCKDCGCSHVGSLTNECDATTGQCLCREGFSGRRCDVCPDGTRVGKRGCREQDPSAEPCGKSLCQFGSTCSKSVDGSMQCVCMIDCDDPKYFTGAVCGNDGNTYRSECQLRLNSCRTQKHVSISTFGPCKDAPTSIYGPSKVPRQIDIQRDSGRSSPGECSTDRDCREGMTCVEKRCKEALSPCDPNPCHGGGACEEHDGTFSCYCPDGLAGTRCEHDLSGVRLVPSFNGRESRVSIRRPDDYASRIDVELEFRPLRENGLLMFAQSGEAGEAVDFVSLAIVNSYVEFRFDLGDGPLVLRSNTPVSLGEWHHLTAKRYHQDGLLKLGEEDQVTGSTKGSVRSLDIEDRVWIGATPGGFSRSGTTSGFLGCLRRVRLGRRTINIQTDLDPNVLDRFELEDCEGNPCAEVPCQNGGTCQVQKMGFQCQCKTEFTGPRCQRKRTQCNPNPCKNGGKCRLRHRDGDFRCKCQDGFDGRLCEDEIRFKKSLDPSTPLTDRDRISFTLRTSSSNLTVLAQSILFHDAIGSLVVSISPTGYLGVELRDQAMLFAVTTPARVSDGREHRVSLAHADGRLRIRVDDEEVSESGLGAALEKPQIRFIENRVTFHAESVVCIQNYRLAHWIQGIRLKSYRGVDNGKC